LRTGCHFYLAPTAAIKDFAPNGSRTTDAMGQRRVICQADFEGW
jgi:hypothetical protein